MKKLIFLSFILLTTAMCVSAQDAKQATPAQFTKAELLGFADVKALLTAIDKGKDYSKYSVRNFNLSTTVVNADGTSSKISEMGPGGTWSEKQRSLIEKHAVKGTVFTVDGITMIEPGTKGKTEQPAATFTIKE